MFTLSGVRKVLKGTASEWKQNKTLKLGASLSYYSVFSLPPLLIIAIAVVGILYGEDAARGHIAAQFEGILGIQGARIVQTVIERAGFRHGGELATVLGILALIFGATGAVAELQDSLNIIWKVKPKPNLGIGYTIKNRLLAVLLILGFGFVLLGLLIITAVVSAVTGALKDILPPVVLNSTLFRILNFNFLISLGADTVMVALVFRILPAADIKWADIWLGAFVTAALFTVGKLLIGYYLGRTAIASLYGAAGSLVILLLWVYYSSQIFFFGAEFTGVYANAYGTKIAPKDYAVRAEGEARRF